MKSIKFFCCLLLLVSMNMACDKEYINQKPDMEEQLIVDYLVGLDYNLDDIEFKDEFVVYQSDAGWNKEDLLISIKNGESIPTLDDPDAADYMEATERQRVHSNVTRMITRQNVSNITYFIRQSIVNDLNEEWRDALVTAATVWSNIDNCRINITRTYNLNTADIINMLMVTMVIIFSIPQSPIRFL